MNDQSATRRRHVSAEVPLSGWPTFSIVEVAVGRSVRRPRPRVGLRLDHMAGMLDGLRGLPADAEAANTARLRRIHHWSVAQRNRLVGFYEPQLESLRSMCEQLMARRLTESGLLEECIATVDRVGQQGPQTRRRFGESGLSDDLVGNRRRAEFERTLAEAIGQARIHEAAVGSLDAHISACEHRLAALEEQKRCELVQLAAMAGKRRAAYLAGLSATHPDRRALIESFDAHSAIEDEQEHSGAIHLVKAEETA